MPGLDHSRMSFPVERNKEEQEETRKEGNVTQH